MTERFEKRLPNTSYGVHDAETAAQAGGMTLEELERCFYQAIVDDYQQAFDGLRRQRPCVLWEQAVAASGVPQYLGSPDDLKLLLMKAVNRKTPHHGYRVQNGNRLSFQGRWYVCPGLLSRLRGREFDLYYDRRDVGVLYIFVGGEYVGEAYCPQLMGGRVTMDNLMKLVTTALEWSYLAGETEVRAERLKSAAELLVLRHDTLKLIDGAGPDVRHLDQ